MWRRVSLAPPASASLKRVLETGRRATRQTRPPQQGGRRTAITEAEFWVVADRLRPALVAYALARIGDPDEATDLAQEALLRAWTRRRALRDPDALPAYLRRAVANLCRNWLRDRRSVPASALPELSDAAADVSSEQAVIQAEESRELAAALESLPTTCREVLYIKYADGLSYEEVGSFLGLSRHTVDWRLRHARSLLVKQPVVAEHLRPSRRSQCPGVERRLQSLVDGEARPSETARALAHAAECPSCAEALRGLVDEFIQVGRAVRRRCRPVPEEFLTWRSQGVLWHHAYSDRPSHRQLAEALAALPFQSPGALAHQASQAVARGRHDRALTLCRKAAWACPTDPVPQRALSLLALFTDDLGSAIQHALLASRLAPHVPTYRTDLAERLVQAGEVGEAERELRRAISELPKVPELVTALSRLLFLRCGYEGALRAAARAIRLCPAAWEPWHWRGMALQGQGRFGLAKRAFRAALRRRPTRADPYEALACLCKPAEARQLLAAALDAAPDDPWTYVTVAHYHTLRGEYDAEAELLSEAIRLDPDNGFFHTFRGGALLLAGRDEEARPHLLRAAELKPNWHPPFFRLGRVAQRAGRLREAEMWYRRTIELGPIPPASPHQLDLVEAAVALAEMLVPQGNVAEALVLCRRARRSAPGDTRLATLEQELRERLASSA